MTSCPERQGLWPAYRHSPTHSFTRPKYAPVHEHTIRKCGSQSEQHIHSSTFCVRLCAHGENTLSIYQILLLINSPRAKAESNNKNCSFSFCHRSLKVKDWYLADALIRSDAQTTCSDRVTILAKR